MFIFGHLKNEYAWKMNEIGKEHLCMQTYMLLRLNAIKFNSEKFYLEATFPIGKFTQNSIERKQNAIYVLLLQRLSHPLHIFSEVYATFHSLVLHIVRSEVG